MHLANAFSLSTPELVAFVGAGGKKTAMKQLVSEASDRGLCVGYTTTTHTPPPGYPLVLADPEHLRGKLERTDASPVAFARERVPNPDRADEKVRGFAPAVVNGVFQSGRFDWLCVKADGARRRGFKAPGADEPAIPDASTTVVPIASVDVVGHPLNAECVHRVERVTELTDLARGDPLTPDILGQVLSHPNGGLKDVPESARVVPLVNKADTETDRQTAQEVLRAAFARTDRFERGIVASLQHGSLTVIEA
jgi:probable selenium-dependent hydroxylase accessory protein YqeC